MKNSIEKDIHLLESYAGMTHKMTDNQGRPKLDQAIEHVLEDYKRVLKENEELKEYISISPNLDEMTAVKYRNIQQDAYIKGRAEEQQRAEQIIYENCIPTQKVKDKIKELDERIKNPEKISYWASYTISECIGIRRILQELLEEAEK